MTKYISGNIFFNKLVNKEYSATTLVIFFLTELSFGNTSLYFTLISSTSNFLYLLNNLCLIENIAIEENITAIMINNKGIEYFSVLKLIICATVSFTSAVFSWTISSFFSFSTILTAKTLKCGETALK